MAMVSPKSSAYLTSKLRPVAVVEHPMDLGTMTKAQNSGVQVKTGLCRRPGLRSRVHLLCFPTRLHLAV